MTILEEIVAHKRMEVGLAKAKVPIPVLEQTDHFGRTPISLADSILASDNGIIAEFKRKSPSKGIINNHSKPDIVVKDYEKAGVAGASILTDWKYFGGWLDDVQAVRESVRIPMLRKEFIVEEYQIIEAKAIGADAILLISECLTKEEIARFSATAKSLGLDVLLEMHDPEHIDKVNDNVAMVGINNRDLRTFKVDIETSISTAMLLPTGTVKIAESGLSEASTVVKLREAGFNGFLMGEAFMRESDPGKACADFINKLRGLV